MYHSATLDPSHHTPHDASPHTLPGHNNSSWQQSRGEHCCSCSNVLLQGDHKAPQVCILHSSHTNADSQQHMSTAAWARQQHPGRRTRREHNQHNKMLLLLFRSCTCGSCTLLHVASRQICKRGCGNLSSVCPYATKACCQPAASQNSINV